MITGNTFTQFLDYCTLIEELSVALAEASETFSFAVTVVIACQVPSAAGCTLLCTPQSAVLHASVHSYKAQTIAYMA